MNKIKTVIAAAAVILWILTTATTNAQVIERINIDSDEAQSTLSATVPKSTRVVSADGRFVVFSSTAGDLVANDTNGVSDVFLRDRSLGTTTRISVNKDDGGDASAESHTPSISGNGRFIAFASLASDLVDGDGNGFLDVFVYDRVAGQMVRASFAASIGETDGDSIDPYIDGDGRYVVFTSTATNLVSEGANTNQDIYLFDLFLKEITKITVRPVPALSEGYSRLPAISSDGRHVVFSSRDTELVAGDTNGTQDVFVRDLQTWAIERVSLSTGGAEADGWNGEAAINADGSVVAWWSTATNLVEGDDNEQSDIFVRDRTAGTTTRVNVSSEGEQSIGAGSWHVTITDDGRFVVFLSDASNLDDRDVNGTGDVFSYDRLTGITRLHSLTPGGTGGNFYSRCPSVTGDGLYIAFESGASDFVDDDDNVEQDVFLAWGPAMVIMDGFESADTSRWSATVPNPGL